MISRVMAASPTPVPSRRTCASWLVAGAPISLVVVAGVTFGIHRHRQAESTPALRAEAGALKLGCFSCHGLEGHGGVTDPSARSGLVPGFRRVQVRTAASIWPVTCGSSARTGSAISTIRSALTAGSNPNYWSEDIGFRCAKDVP